jgi:hypothetical protein
MNEDIDADLDGLMEKAEEFQNVIDHVAEIIEAVA